MLTEKYVTNIIYEKTVSTFSIKDAVSVSIVLQCLLRYSANISFPPAKIYFLQEVGSEERCFPYHGKYGINGIDNYATTHEYANKPLDLCSLIENKKIIINWFKTFSDDDKLQAIKNYCRARDLKFINDKIVQMVKVFDKISQLDAKYKEKIMDKEVFKKWLDEVSSYVYEKSNERISKNQLKSLLGPINCASLGDKLKDILNDCNSKNIREKNDIDAISNYLINLRNADSHSGYTDLAKLPNGYKIADLLKIINDAVKYLINKNVLQIDSAL